MITPLIALLSITQTSRVDKIWDDAANIIDVKLDRIYHAGLYEECVVLLRVLRGMDPADADVASNLIFMLRNVERKDEAFAEAQRFFKQNPNSIAAAGELARFHFEKKQWQSVVTVLEPSIARSSDIAGFTMLGRAYEELDRPKDALRIWTIRIKKQPEDPVARRNVDRLTRKLAGG